MPVALSYPAHAKALLVLGVPLIGGHLARFAIGVTDVMMLGWYSVDALAAGVLGSSYFFVFFLFGSGFAWAAMPMIASALSSGEEDAERTVRRVTRMAFWTSALFFVCALPAFLYSEPILVALGQEPDFARDVAVYVRITAVALFPALIVSVLQSYLAAQERTSVVFWVTILAAVVNAGINYLLIFGMFGFPELGLAGAAWASVGVQVVSFIALAIYAVRVFPQHALFQRLWRPDWPAFLEVGRLGLPIGLTSLAEVGLFSASAVMMGWLGTVPLAAHGIALQCASATFLVHLGLSNAATIRAGQAAGMRDAVFLRDGAATAVVLSLVFAALTVTMFLTVPEVLLGLFLDPAEPEREAILALGVVLMVFAALFQVVDGLQVIALGLLRGLKDTSWPLVYASVSYWLIGLPSSYILGFPLGFGGPGIWTGLVVGLAFAAVSLLWRFWSRQWIEEGTPTLAE